MTAAGVGAGVVLAPETVVWYVLGSVAAAVRRAYALARENREPQVIAFCPRIKTVRGPSGRGLVVEEHYLTIRGFGYGFLDSVRAKDSGLGSIMIYRVCDVQPPGYLAKKGGVRGPEEMLMLGRLLPLYPKRYVWRELGIE